MADNFFTWVAGKMKVIAPIFQSTGVADGGKIAGTDPATGRWHMSLMPSGIGEATVIATATEAIVKGDLLNLYLTGATLNCRKAIADTNKYVAHAFAAENISSGATGSAQREGIISVAANTFTTLGDLFLSDTTAGKYMLTAPALTKAGEIIQRVGQSISDHEWYFQSDEEIVIGVGLTSKFAQESE